jgi:hypothetical protein
MTLQTDLHWLSNLLISLLKSSDRTLHPARRSNLVPVDKLIASFRLRYYKVYLSVYLSSVCIRGYSSGWTSGKYWLCSRNKQEIFLCLKASRPAFGPSQPHIILVSKTFTLRPKRPESNAIHYNLVFRLWMSGAIPPLLYMPSCSVQR